MTTLCKTFSAEVAAGRAVAPLRTAGVPARHLLDRVVIVAYGDDGERARVTGLRGARRLLGWAALGDDAVARAVDELHRRRAVVLVDLREIAAGDARDQLERLAHAA